MARIKLILSILFFSFSTFAQNEDLEDFDFSEFEEAGTVLKAFCTNKVLGQSPSQLVSIGYDYQGSTRLSSGAMDSIPSEETNWNSAQGFRLVSNIPIISKNNILVNWGISYIQLGFPGNREGTFTNPLNRTLNNHSLKWLNTNFTIFKPFDDKHFLLLQVGAELNGDYDFNNLPEMSNIRLPGALIFGIKPNDRIIWGPGISRTYLGGALNYLPVIYYYHTFKNEHWGVEALFPARIQGRYRFNSRNLLLAGYSVEGATYRLSNINSTQFNPENNTELRRSEIRAGLTYSLGLNDFLWLSLQAGYRINYSYDLDKGDFYRGFDDDNYLLLNDLSNTLFAQITFSLVSP